MLISDLSSYVCSSDLADARLGGGLLRPRHPWPQVLEALVDGRHRSPRPLGADPHQRHAVGEIDPLGWCVGVGGILFGHRQMRSEEHTSELQSLMRISYAVFCLQKNNENIEHNNMTYC